MLHIDLNNYGIRVVNFAEIFTNAYKDIVKDLYIYDKFHDHNVRSQDTRRIYYYHMIKHMCDTIISSKTDKKIVIFYSEKDIKCDFIQCRNKRTRHLPRNNVKSDFHLFMNRFFKAIKSMIPVKMYVSDVKFNTFIQYYNTNKGKYLEIINTLRVPKNRSNFTMERFKKFVTKFGLTYLDKHYIDSVKLKCVMYK